MTWCDCHCDCDALNRHKTIDLTVGDSEFPIVPNISWYDSYSNFSYSVVAAAQRWYIGWCRWENAARSQHIWISSAIQGQVIFLLDQKFDERFQLATLVTWFENLMCMVCWFIVICTACRYTVLGSTDSTNIGNIGAVQWHLAVCLLLGWILVYVCIIKGVKSSGKVSCCYDLVNRPKQCMLRDLC